MTNIPENYRQLKSTENYENGDLHYHINRPHDIHPIRNGSGPVSDYCISWRFFRRRHTKKVPVVTQLTSAADVVKEQAKNVAVVSFDYGFKWRFVQLITLDTKYLIGLEITNGRDRKKKYQFKRFLVSKILGSIKLESYGPK